MKRLKQGIIAVSRATRLRLLLEPALGAALAAHQGLGRCLAWSYRRCWPLLGQPYYDQRFVAARGPEAWVWTERGMFAHLHSRPGAVVLDLCCGDGLFPALFTSAHAAHIDALDRDQRAIAAARRRYSRPNLSFHRADILADPFPRDQYDTVTCFASLQYFSAEELRLLLGKIAAALGPRQGQFLGSVPLFPAERADPYAKTNFESLEQVGRVLRPHFDQVMLQESRAGIVPNCYFRALAAAAPAADAAR